MDDFNKIWEDFGCNLYEVIVLEICTNRNQDDEQIIAWDERYGVKYPAVSGEGGGAGVTSAYSVPYTPSAVLIEPDRTYSRPGISSIYRTLENLSVEKHSCDPTEAEDHSIILGNHSAMSIGEVHQQFISLTVPENGFYTVRVYSANGRCNNIILDSFLIKGNHRISWNAEGLANSVFFVELSNTKQKEVRKIVLYESKL